MPQIAATAANTIDAVLQLRTVATAAEPDTAVVMAAAWTIPAQTMERDDQYLIDRSRSKRMASKLSESESFSMRVLYHFFVTVFEAAGTVLREKFPPVVPFADFAGGTVFLEFARRTVAAGTVFLDSVNTCLLLILYYLSFCVLG